jgi:D-xylose reductase
MGLGIWKIPNDVCAETVYQAIKMGYRCIDSALVYGNEKEAGEGLARAIKEGIVKREDMFITSKLWNTDHRPEHVEAACRRSCADFQTDYLDLFLIHFPVSLAHTDHSKKYPPNWYDMEEKWNPDHGVTYEQTWHAMEELVDKKLARDIGVSNVKCVKVVDVIKYARIKPSVLQVEIHPFLTQPKLCRFVQELGLQVTAYSSFGSLSYLELKMATDKDTFMLSPALLEPAKKYNKTAPQVALRWAVQKKYQVIPKSTKEARLKENMEVFDFHLTAEEIAAIDNLNCEKRFNDPNAYGLDFFYPIQE